MLIITIHQYPGLICSTCFLTGINKLFQSISVHLFFLDWIRIINDFIFNIIYLRITHSIESSSSTQTKPMANSTCNAYENQFLLQSIRLQCDIFHQNSVASSKEKGHQIEKRTYVEKTYEFMAMSTSLNELIRSDRKNKQFIDQLFSSFSF